jgi:hypothetical protein
MYMATTSASIFEEDDMVFNKSGGSVKSAGFTVNSILMQKGGAALVTRNTGLQTGGGNVADLFKDLAVPAGLANFNRQQFGGDIQDSKIQNKDEPISNELHEKLLKMVEVDKVSKPRKTRRSNIESAGKTKKHRPMPSSSV